MNDINTSPLAYVPLYLPSKGVLYEGRIPDGKVEARGMNVQDIAYFESNGSSAHEKIERLLKTCVKLPNGFEHRDLLLTDRMALLFSLRTLTIKSGYDYAFRCPHCGTFNERTADLATELTQTEPEPGLTEPIAVHLDGCNADVEIRFLRGRDEEAVAKYAKRIKLKSVDSEDPSLSHRIALQLITINGEKPDILERERFAKGMPFDDLLTLVDLIATKEPGIDTEIVADCSKCQAPNKVELGLTAEFFRRSRRSARSA